MKIIYIILIIIILAVAVISYYGITVPANIQKLDCASFYQEYTYPNTLCQWLSGGHCPTTGLNKLKVID